MNYKYIAFIAISILPLTITAIETRDTTSKPSVWSRLHNWGSKVKQKVKQKFTKEKPSKDVKLVETHKRPNTPPEKTGIDRSKLPHYIVDGRVLQAGALDESDWNKHPRKATQEEIQAGKPLS